MRRDSAGGPGGPEYISRAGAARLQAELDALLTVERPRVVETVAAAAAEGDRSENAEYIYGKKRLREIDRRVGFLSRRFDHLTIAARPTSIDRVVFLSWVRLEDGEGAERIYQLVGADESEPSEGRISYLSPVGQAILGRRVDDEVKVQTPRGRIELTVIEISAEPFPDGPGS